MTSSHSADRARARLLADRAAALGVAAAAAGACAQVIAFLDAMLERNQALNLTGVRDPGQADILHGLDSLAAGLAGLAPTRALDLGSGNGFPGIALAALFPDAEVDLLERTAKKARALDELLARVPVGRTQVIHGDAAQLPALQPHRRARYDLIAARAVGPPPRIAKLAAPLAAPGGHLLLWLDGAAKVPRAPGGGFTAIRSLPYDLPPPAARRRLLAVYRRNASTRDDARRDQALDD